ncbi:TlpA family protein disulfide reductase [Natronobacterium texcoconense]|uniref:Thiol-disulfide isomerase or thioredoxin n=1 Tax=Natronobacterium texcoconense TaxID=1095778 RepID=A0A1H0ZY37_NATTX|nr:TlpA disulfide reductase family protein [Natronobacterium texcoconense]SDQ32161.1 Thiol-disulfide isomerase or thioredoxin [Natronobacterium texcoconense]
MPRLTRRHALHAGVVSSLALAGCTDSIDRIPVVGGGEIDDVVDEQDGPVTLERVDGDSIEEHPVVDTDRELTLLYFFATWCEPCAPQNEELADVEAAIGDDVAMHAISPESDTDLVADYWADSPSSFPALVDPDAAVMEYFSVRGYPSLVLVDSSGRVLWEPGDERENLAIGTVPADVILEQLE